MHQLENGGEGPVRTGLTVIAYITAKAGHQDEVRDALLDLVAQTLQKSMRSGKKQWESRSYYLESLFFLPAVGWFKRRLWGWWLAVFIIGTQVLGGLVHVFLGRVVEGGLGFVTSGALLFYLLRVKVRAIFDDGTG